MYGTHKHDITYYPSPSRSSFSVLPPESPVSLSAHPVSRSVMSSSAGPRSAAALNPHVGPNRASSNHSQVTTGPNGPPESSGQQEPFTERTSRLMQSGYDDSVPLIIQGPSVPFGFKAPFPTPETTDSTNQTIEPWFYSPVSPAPSVYPIYSGSRVLDDVAPLADDADEWAVWSRSEAAVTIVPPSPLRTVCKRCFDHRVECSWPGADGAGACSNCFFSYSLCSIVQPASIDHSVRPTLESIPSTDSLDASVSQSTRPSDVPISSSVFLNANASSPSDPGTPRTRSVSLSALPMPQLPMPSSSPSSSRLTHTSQTDRPASQIAYPSHQATVISSSNSSSVTDSPDQSQPIHYRPPYNPTSCDQIDTQIVHRPILPTPQASSSSSSSVSQIVSPDPLVIHPDRFALFREAEQGLSSNVSLVPPSPRTGSLVSSASSSRPYSTTDSSIQLQSNGGPDTQMLELFDRVVRLQSDATAGLVQVRSILQETETVSSVPIDTKSRKKEKKERKRRIKEERRKEKEKEKETQKEIVGPKENDENESMEEVIEEENPQMSTERPIAGTHEPEKPQRVTRRADGEEERVG